MTRFALALCLSLTAPVALAETAAEPVVDPHAGHSMTGEESPSTTAFMEANAAMHGGMAITYTGDADVDFITGMIPHPQGAVAMARIVLEHGDDPEVRKLAEAVIAAQEAEIAWMQDWLKKQQN